MNIWLVKIGEPIPLSSSYTERLHRTGLLSLILARSGHTVTWWTSTFDRVMRRNIFEDDATVRPFDGLSIKMIHSPGYRRSISFDRLRDHRIMAAKFRRHIRHEPPPDIIVCAYPTVELSMASVQYARQNGIPVVLDIRDMWPDIIIDSFPELTRPFFRILLKGMFRDASMCCGEATALTGITDAFVQWGLNKGNRQRSALDRNFPLGYLSSPPEARRMLEAEGYWDDMGVKEGSEDFIVCFLGTFGKHFDLRTPIAAARKLQKMRSGIRFVFCGDGDYLKDMKKAAQGCGNIIFPGWVDEAKMYVLLRRSTVGLNPIIDRYDFLSTINNKSIEYMSAGLPVIMCPRNGVFFDFLGKYRCGEGYEYANPEDLMRVLINLSRSPELCAEMSRNARQVFMKRFDADLVYTDMMRHLENIVRVHPESLSH